MSADRGVIVQSGAHEEGEEGGGARVLLGGECADSGESCDGAAQNQAGARGVRVRV